MPLEAARSRDPSPQRKTVVGGQEANMPREVETKKTQSILVKVSILVLGLRAPVSGLAVA